MCGRFTLTTPHRELQLQFDGLTIPPYTPNYNITPGQNLMAIVQDDDGQRHLRHFKWGLVPYWAKDTRIGYKLTNARAESITEKASFKYAFKRRRCLVIADGYYEWKREGKSKRPFYFQMGGGELFAFAALWERWTKGETPLETCSLITTAANALAGRIHHRMPLLLERESQEIWLNGKASSQDLIPLLSPYAGDALSTYEVSTYVNASKNNGKECIDPLPSADLVTDNPASTKIPIP